MRFAPAGAAFCIADYFTFDDDAAGTVIRRCIRFPRRLLRFHARAQLAAYGAGLPPEPGEADNTNDEYDREHHGGDHEQWNQQQSRCYQGKELLHG